MLRRRAVSQAFVAQERKARASVPCRIDITEWRRSWCLS